VGFSKVQTFPTIRHPTATCDLLSNMMGGYRNYQIRYEFQLQFLEFGVICLDEQEVKVGFRDVIFQHQSRKKKYKKSVLSVRRPETELKGKSDTALTGRVQHHSVIRRPAIMSTRYSTANL
jgi:hypothetical protein